MTASIDNIALPGDTDEQAAQRLRAVLEPMGEGVLLAQQITQQGAIHAIETLLARGCSEQVARAMLASLRANMAVIEATAREKGFTKLFGSAAP